MANSAHRDVEKGLGPEDMLSNSDIKTVEKVLSMSPEQLKSFVGKLTPGAQTYLDVILEQYEGTLED